MIRGHLKAFVLMFLEKGAKTGYSLMNEIHTEVGHKPSPGSMYPLLDTLEKEGFVKAKKEGRSILYSITKEGKKELSLLKKKKDELINKISAVANVLENVSNKEEHSFFLSVLKQVKEGKFPFAHLEPDISEMRNSLIPFIESKHENIDKVRKLMKKMTKELKKLQ